MNRFCRHVMFSTLSTAAVCAAHVDAQSGGGPYRVKPSVIAGGGGSAAGGTFQVRGTFGQSATANSSASGYRFYAGFWSPLAGSESDLIFANGFDT